MEIYGKVEEIVKNDNNKFEKLDVYVDDLVEDNSCSIEFRKNLIHVAKVLKKGDTVRIQYYNTRKIDRSGNAHNNKVATQIIREK